MPGTAGPVPSHGRRDHQCLYRRGSRKGSKHDAASDEKCSFCPFPKVLCNSPSYLLTTEYKHCVLRL